MSTVVAKPLGKPDAKAKKARKSFWLKQLHTWHWISSAISLIGLLAFAFTGITLNHAADIEGEPKVVESANKLPADLLKQVAADDKPDVKKPLPVAVAKWVGAFAGRTATGEAEWSASEVYLALPRPGGDGWVSIDRETGAVSSEATDRGWIERPHVSGDKIGRGAEPGSLGPRRIEHRFAQVKPAVAVTVPLPFSEVGRSAAGDFEYPPDWRARKFTGRRLEEIDLGGVIGGAEGDIVVFGIAIRVHLGFGGIGRYDRDWPAAFGDDDLLALLDRGEDRGKGLIGLACGYLSHSPLLCSA